MKKVFVVAGQTGLGKTQLSFQLAKSVRTDIIIGDSLQIYKNWPITSNYPPLEYQSQIKYHLLGQMDAFKQRISIVQNLVRDTIQLILQKNPYVIVEGGSCFYLNYLLNAGKEEFSQEHLEEIQQQFNALPNQDLSQQLKSLCPSYDDSIPHQDSYRLEKAIKFALLTDGKRFKLDNMQQNGGDLRSLYDIRGVFLYARTSRVLKILDKRCDRMVESGMLNEFLNNRSMIDGLLDQQCMPIGFKEAQVLLQGLQGQMNKLDYSSRKERQTKFLKLIQDFVFDFQTKTRQYATYQRKYFRNKMNGFVWIEIDSDAGNEVQLVQQLIRMSRDEYDQIVNSIENTGRRQSREDVLVNKSLISQTMEFNRQEVINHINGDIIPRLRRVQLQ